MSADREIKDIERRWASAGVKIDAYIDSDHNLHLSRIVVPKEARGEGHGTSAMRNLIAVADRHRLTMTLTPATDFGGSSVERLKKFYKRFGFVENKGRHKDFSISASMYRTPASLKKVSEDVMRFPKISEVAAELRRINKEDSADDGDDGRIDVRLQVHEDGQWAVHWGSADYDQDHRGYWGSSSVPGDNRRFDSKDLARDLIDQAREQKATGGDEDDEDDDIDEVAEAPRVNSRARLEPIADAKHFREFLINNVIVVEGEADGVDLDDEDSIFVAIVYNVTGTGRLPAAIYAGGKNGDHALEEAHQILEEWEEEHYPYEDDEDEEHRTETFDGRVWELAPEEFEEAIRGTGVEKFFEHELEGR